MFLHVGQKKRVKFQNPFLKFLKDTPKPKPNGLNCLSSNYSGSKRHSPLLNFQKTPSISSITELPNHNNSCLTFISTRKLFACVSSSSSPKNPEILASNDSIHSIDRPVLICTFCNTSKPFIKRQRRRQKLCKDSNEKENENIMTKTDEKNSLILENTFRRSLLESTESSSSVLRYVAPNLPTNQTFEEAQQRIQQLTSIESSSPPNRVFGNNPRRRAANTTNNLSYKRSIRVIGNDEENFLVLINNNLEEKPAVQKLILDDFELLFKREFIRNQTCMQINNRDLRRRKCHKWKIEDDDDDDGYDGLVSYDNNCPNFKKRLFLDNSSILSQHQQPRIETTSSHTLVLDYIDLDSTTSTGSISQSSSSSSSCSTLINRSNRQNENLLNSKLLIASDFIHSISSPTLGIHQVIVNHSSPRPNKENEV